MFTGSILILLATPLIPIELFVAPIIPAQAIPWPLHVDDIFPAFCGTPYPFGLRTVYPSKTRLPISS